MYARSNCSVAPAAAETDGSFRGIPVAFMDFARAREKLERVERLEVAMSVPLVKAMQQAEWPAQPTRQLPAPKASQPVELRLLSESRPAQVMPVRAIAPVVER
jgi:hypothetical protein